MKRVLLTGASGFVGRGTIAPLRELGYEIHATTTQAKTSTDGVVWHRVDLLKTGEPARLAKSVGASHLLHIAWYAEPGKYWQSPINLEWLTASVDLLRNFVEAGGKRVVMVGTCAEYDWDHGYCHELHTPRRPGTVYGTCKAALGDVLQAYAGQMGLSHAWARLFFMYGPGEPSGRLVPSVVQALLAGQTPKCTHGRQVRDFLHVDDVSSALVATMHGHVEGPVNIGSGQPHSLRDLADEIARQLHRPGQVAYGALPAPANDPPFLVANCTRLQEEVGWSPRHTLSTGIADTLTWWTQQSQPDSP